ncbi:TolC family protein [Sungkyunkwania multivorans]|uniref:TolC family protein n=1 Tax=Sungkyunkwania multivorans TaxID=1173618 RepID=A0ABW3D384_9FLAO
MLHKFPFIVLLLVGFTATAQELLTKEEAVQYTLENNLGIKVAKNNEQIAKNNAGILGSGYLPTITGNAAGSIDRQNTEGQLANGDSRTAEGVETRRYNASINLNYTLFDGLGRYYDYKRFKEEYNQSELQVRQTIENTILQLFTVYYEVARLEENTNNLQEALKISKDRLLRARYQFDYGQNTGLDVLNAEVDVNTDSINFLNATQLLRNTKRDLNLVMNRDLSARFVSDTTVSFVPNLAMESVFAEAKQNNVQLLLIEKDMAILDYGLKGARSSFLPTIGLTGSYGWNESSNNNPLAFVIQNSSNGLSGGVNLTWNLFEGGRNINAVKNAKIAYQNQEILQRQTELQVERDIKNAWDSYRNALFVLEVQEKNLQTNQNNFLRTNERYKLGQVNSIEFRQAQINLLNAKLARSQAKYSAKLAELLMLQVSGQLLNVDF